jgi:hypothetical protein
MASDTIWPFPVVEPVAVSMIADGDVIPAYTESYGRGSCTNCHDPEGMMIAWKVGGKGRVTHHFTDRYGQGRTLQARLLSAPCPVCRPQGFPREGGV